MFGTQFSRYETQNVYFKYTLGMKGISFSFKEDVNIDMDFDFEINWRIKQQTPLPKP